MSRFAALLLALATIPSPAAGDDKRDDPPGPKLSADEQAVLDLTNAERKKADLPPLKPHPQLMEAARAHAKNMAAQGTLTHVLDEKGPGDRVAAAGYKYAAVGENILWNAAGPKQAVAGWMDSKPHKENVLKDAYADVGVAVAKSAKGEPYWVQVFGKPKGE